MNQEVSKIRHYSGSIASVVLTAGLGIGFFTLLSGATTAWHEEVVPALLSLRHGLMIAAGCAAISLGLAAITKQVPRLSLAVWAGLAIVFILSDWLPRRYTFFHGAPIRGELLLCGVIVVAIIRHNALWIFKLLLPLSLLLLGGIFISKTSGQLLFSDDLATFMYRLALLKARFPLIPFYNPQWNGGIDQRDFFATGALNVFLLSSPLLYLVDVLKGFNWVVGMLLFVLTPLATVLAAFLLGYGWLVASVAATLAMTSGLLWYKWALAFGTLGFITSAALLPLFLACTTVFIAKERAVTVRFAIAFALVATLMLLWSPSGLAIIPAILCCGVYAHSVLQKRNSITAALLIVALNIPWMMAFWSVSNVGSFIHPEISKGASLDSASVMDSSSPQPEPKAEAPETSLAHIKQVVRPTKTATPLSILRETAIFTNPFLLILIPAGLLLLPARVRVLYGATAVWLVLLGAVISHLRPQLELERMLIMLGIVGAIPAAVAFERLLKQSAISSTWRGPLIPTAAVGSFLLLGPFGVTNFFEQRTLIRYHLADGIVKQMVDAINRFGGDGRVLFSGFVLHDLSGGHLAPLALMTTKPLMASSHVHNLWQHKDIFPEFFEELGDAGIERYLELYNVTAVFAHEQKWQEYFITRPTHFTKVWERGNFMMFTRADMHSNYFLSGSGAVLQQTTHSLVASLNTPDAVLKFNYLPFLRASGCEVTAAPQEGGIELIRLTGCPVGVPITIESKSIAARLWGAS